MEYQDKNEAMVGDTIEMVSREIGTVVASLDSGNYSDDYPKSDWEYLNEGLLVDSDSFGLLHFTDNSELVRLVRRGS